MPSWYCLGETRGFARKAQSRFYTQQTFWVQKGDRCFREFFRAVRQRYSSNSLQRLVDDSGVLQTDPGRLMEITSYFSSDLYSALTVTKEIDSVRGDLEAYFSNG